MGSLLSFRKPIAAFASACLVGLFAGGAAAAPRERAAEQIPELMGRILESQEEIQARQDRLVPMVQRWEGKLGDSRRRIEEADSESEAAEALVDYVEAYNQRLEIQAEGLRSIEGPIARMYADAKQLVRVAESSGDGEREAPAVREAFLRDQFQGVAGGISALADELGRQEDASVAGAVLHAGWAAENTPAMPLSKVGPEAAITFARRTEGLYARFQARSRQLEGERRAVRQLLDMLIERQLAQRMDSLFSDGPDGLLGGLLSGEGRSEDWLALGDVVNRALGLPTSVASAGGGQGAALERLDFFADGRHRD